MSKDGTLNRTQTRLVIECLWIWLGTGKKRRRPNLNRVAVCAVLGRETRWGESRSAKERKKVGRLQRTLSRYLSRRRPALMRVKTFNFLVDHMAEYAKCQARGGWLSESGREWSHFKYALESAKQVGGELDDYVAITSTSKWVAVPLEEELELTSSQFWARWRKGALPDLPDWAESYFRAFVREGIKAGVPGVILREVCLRIAAPFLGHSRSGGRLYRWGDLTKSALKRALRSSIRAERIWLGLDGGLKRGVAPLRERVVGGALDLAPIVGD